MKYFHRVITVLVMAGTAMVGSAYAAKLPSGYGIVTKEQKRAEALALRLMKSPAVLAAQKQIEQVYGDDPVYQTPGAPEIMEAAVREVVYMTATYVATEDSQRPMLLWTFNAPRKSDGVDIPGTRFIESMDSIYRVVNLDATHHYELSGKMPKDGSPAFTVFEVWNSPQGLQPDVKYMGHIAANDLVLNPDGSFKLRFGPEPAEGRKNYLQTAKGGWLIIRQSLSDWMKQSPILNLKIRMLEKPDRPAPTFAELEKRLVDVLPQATQLNRTYMHRMFEEQNGAKLYIGFGNSLNHLNPAVATRGGAWGYVTGTRYLLGDDQAMVITMTPGDAKYFSIVLHDAWGRTLDPYSFANRNNSVSTPNPDGTVTYVIASKDPGVANWLDTGGHGSGAVIMRWQGVTVARDGSPAELIKDSKVVALDELKMVLPEGVPMTSSAERCQALDWRKTAYERRLK